MYFINAKYYYNNAAVPIQVACGFLKAQLFWGVLLKSYQLEKVRSA